MSTFMHCALEALLIGLELGQVEQVNRRLSSEVRTNG